MSYTGQTNGNEWVLYTELHRVVRTQFWSFESSPPNAVLCHTQDRLMAINGYSTLNCIWWWGHSSGALNPHHTIQFSVIHRTVYWQWTVTLHWTASGGEDTVLELWILTTQCSLVSYTGQTNGNERVLYTELHRVVRTQFWSFESSPPDAVKCHTEDRVMAMNGYSILNCIWWWGHSSGALNPHHPMQFSVIHRTD